MRPLLPTAGTPAAGVQIATHRLASNEEQTHTLKVTEDVYFFVQSLEAAANNKQLYRSVRAAKINMCKAESKLILLQVDTPEVRRLTLCKYEYP